MKTLTLLRHAKSSWADRGLSDFDRPLNKRGQIAAPLMGKRLVNKSIKPDIIVSSPAKRAAQTIKIICELVNYPKPKIVWNEKIYEASTSTLISIIQEINSELDHVLLCGHNPGFTDLSNLLTDKKNIDNIPTCGVVSINFDIQNWNHVSPGIGELSLFDFPKNPKP